MLYNLILYAGINRVIDYFFSIIAFKKRTSFDNKERALILPLSFRILITVVKYSLSFSSISPKVIRYILKNKSNLSTFCPLTLFSIAQHIARIKSSFILTSCVFIINKTSVYVIALEISTCGVGQLRERTSSCVIGILCGVVWLGSLPAAHCNSIKLTFPSPYTPTLFK
jgi:hypothetical protein